MTAPTKSKTPVQDFYQEAQETMCNLAGRWQDESEYEDIADYQKVIEPLAAKHGLKIVRMQKRPFGVIAQSGARKYCVSINLTTGEYVMEEVK